MKLYYFEKLEVWKEAKDLVMLIYRLTAEFPVEERYGIVSQLRRASMSIAANIAEGMSRNTEKDKARFINQAFSSAVEVLNFMIIAKELHFLNDMTYMEAREQIEKITNQLNSLYKKFEK